MRLLIAIDAAVAFARLVRLWFIKKIFVLD
jgi:hypothetical protein